MTTYRYKCSDCKNVFEIEATIEEKEEGKSEKFVCLKCKSKNIKQEFSVSNLIKNVFRSDNKSGGCGNRKSNGSCCG